MSMQRMSCKKGIVCERINILTTCFILVCHCIMLFTSKIVFLSKVFIIKQVYSVLLATTEFYITTITNYWQVVNLNRYFIIYCLNV